MLTTVEIAAFCIALSTGTPAATCVAALRVPVAIAVAVAEDTPKALAIDGANVSAIPGIAAAAAISAIAVGLFKS